MNFKVFNREYRYILHSDKGRHKDEVIFKVTGDCWECVKINRMDFKVFNREYNYTYIVRSNKGPHKDKGIFKITGEFIRQEITLFFFPISSNNL
jgi:hypothetical protein